MPTRPSVEKHPGCGDHFHPTNGRIATLMKIYCQRAGASHACRAPTRIRCENGDGAELRNRDSLRIDRLDGSRRRDIVL